MDHTHPYQGLVNDGAVMADPCPMSASWRPDGPVRQSTTPDGSPVWIITRYAEVRDALADRRLSLDKRHSARGYRGFDLPPALDANLLNMDPPHHTRVRRLVSKAFGPHQVELLRPRIQRITDGLLDGLAAGRDAAGHADLVAVLAAPLPLTVIGELIGVPPGDRDVFRQWTDALIAPDPRHPAQAVQAIQAISEFLVTLIAERRKEPGADVLSAMLAARDGADQLSENELISLAFLLLIAGYENTINLIGNAVLELLRHPDQWRLLRSHPELASAAADEAVRHTSPTPFAIRRFAAEDITIAGVTVTAGETVLPCLASAHRDPDQFPDPDRFDLTRGEHRHLGFGHGIHFCIGAQLARMEVETALVGLVGRFPDLTLAVPDTHLGWRPSWRSRGLRALPVRYAGPASPR